MNLLTTRYVFMFSFTVVKIVQQKIYYIIITRCNLDLNKHLNLFLILKDVLYNIINRLCSVSVDLAVKMCELRNANPNPLPHITLRQTPSSLSALRNTCMASCSIHDVTIINPLYKASAQLYNDTPLNSHINLEWPVKWRKLLLPLI